jgi:protoheme IX farnesyltransferase
MQSRCDADGAGAAHLQGALHPRSLPRDLFVLFKAREVLLLLFAAVGGAFLAAGGWPGGRPLVLLLVAGGLAAAGASALNQYMERDLDARMDRTRHRPLVNAPGGEPRLAAFPRPGWVPWLGAGMILLPAAATSALNPTLAVWLLVGAGVYLGVYTLWLKPRTWLNVVVGGLAGSAAVLSGSAAAGRWDAHGALLLALLVFVWTPTHFWSLAIAHREDYARGGFPMLPVQVGPRAAAGWVLLHTAGTALVALALGAQAGLGLLYWVPVGLASLYLLFRNAQLLAEPDRKRALALFGASNLYLALILLIVSAISVVV